MNVGIKIMPRDVILDSQGRAIEDSLKSNGYKLESVRAGKYLELSVLGTDSTLVKSEVERMLTQGGLFNPLIEKYEIYLT